MSIEAAIARLSHCRDVLVRVTAGLEIEALDYRPFPDAKSNGEILLHIAGFEFLMVAVAQAARGEQVDCLPWPGLKAGFAREAGFSPPTGRSLGDYIARLDAVRRGTLAFLTRDAGPKSIAAESCAIRELAQLLATTDPGEDERSYQRLARSVSTSFADDGTPDAEGMVEIPALLLLHETYHRGQVTLNKYIRSRMLSGAPVG